MLSIQLDTSVIAPRALEALTQPTNPVHSTAPAGQQAMNVGVPVRLTLDTSGGSLTDTAGLAWSISGGDPIKDYVISAFDPGNPDDPDGDVRGYLTALDTLALDPGTDLHGVSVIEFYFRETGTFVVTAVAEVDNNVEVANLTFAVQRDPKAEIYYVTGPGGLGDTTPVEDRDNIMGEHWYWHDETEDAPDFVNPGRFFHFHRGFIAKFNAWRGIFGYPCVQIYVPGPNHIPSGRAVDHSGSAGDGNGIVVTARQAHPASIQAMEAQFSILGDGTTKLADFTDEDALHGAIVGWHNSMHGGWLCSAGDFLWANRTPADPIFWRFHFFLTQLHELYQLLKLDGQTIQVLQAGPGGTRVFYPDDNVKIMPDCAGGVPSTLTPAPGHLFPVGTTTVTGQARDVVLLDPDPDPDPAVQAATVGAGSTAPVSFDVEVIPQLATPIPADVYLVLDDTGSMNGITPAGPGGETPTKIQALKDAVPVLADVLRLHREGNGDNLGAFTFKVPSGEPVGTCKPTWLQTLVSFGTLDDRVQNDPANPNDVTDAVGGMPADGAWTPLRTALEIPSDQLNVQPAGRKRWIILLTDGKQNTDDCLIGSVREPVYNDPEVVNFRNDYLASRQINLLAVGFGGGNAVNEPLLRTLAAGPDDYFDFASEGPGSLNKWFTAAVSRVLEQTEIADPHGVIRTGERVKEQVPLTRACRSVTFILTWAEADLECPPGLVIESPGAEPFTLTEDDHDPDRGVTWSSGPHYQIAVLRFPLKKDYEPYHRGTWTAHVTGPGHSGHEESTSYTLAAIADEPGRIHCRLPDRQILSHEPIELRIDLAGLAVRSAAVTAEIVGYQYPIGSSFGGLTAEDQEIIANGSMSEANAGLTERRMDLLNARLAARSTGARVKDRIKLTPVEAKDHAQHPRRTHTYVGTSKPLKADGTYSVRFRLEGVTLLGDRFRRECSMGFTVAPNIREQVGDVHIQSVDDSGLVFDWHFEPGSGGFDGVSLGPGHANDFSISLSGGSAEDVIDMGNGTYKVRIVRDSKEEPTQVTAQLFGGPFAAFQIPSPPTVQAVTPSSGPESGGSRVRVHGDQLDHDSVIRFGEHAAEDITVVSDGVVEVTIPAGEGAVAVAVQQPDGTFGGGSAGFRYLPDRQWSDPCNEEE